MHRTFCGSTVSGGEGGCRRCAGLCLVFRSRDQHTLSENASKEVTSNEVTDEITGEDSDDYTDDFETEFEESDSVQSSSIHPRDWDEELNSSKRCALEELKKLQLGN